MAFKENQRIEQIYFSTIRSNIETLKKWKDGETDLKMADVLTSLINADSALLLVYKNLGEAYSETVSMIKAEKAGLEALRADFASFNTAINAKIDEVNSYLLSLIRALEERVDDLEGRVGNIEHTMNATNRTKTVYIDDIEQDTFTIYDYNTDEELTYSDLENFTGNGYDVILIDFTKEPMIYAEICQYGGEEIVFERTYTFRANSYQLMTHCVQYRINTNDETFYAEDIYDVEEPGRLLNLRALKQANNYYNIFLPNDPEHALTVLALLKMAYAGKNLRVIINLADGSKIYVPLSYIYPTVNQSGTVTGGEIGFTGINFSEHDSVSFYHALTADTQSDYDFRYTSNEIVEA